MKWKLKKAMAAGVCAAMVLSTGTALAADTEKQMAVQVNGENIVLTDAYPQQKGETIYLPLRPVLPVLPGRRASGSSV